MELRVSSGTLSYLGLSNSRCMEDPTTAYLLLPGGPCRGGCVYCPQASGDERWLSRVSWPLMELEEILEPLRHSDLQRICLQSPDVEGFEDRILEAVDILEPAQKPVSISAPPLSTRTLDMLRDGPVDNIGVGIDAVTDELRASTKKNYSPEVFWHYLGNALDIYGPEHVTAHFIVGMGEGLEEVAHAVYRAAKNGARVSLFSYVSKGEEPDIAYYRQAQLLAHLVEEGHDPFDAISIIKEGDGIEQIIEDGSVFQTQGCPGCNRPYYTTRPGREHRNYPRKPTWEEIQKITKDLKTR